jgi:WhiB family transcriptional regulator, redox-sensing transcriptional regulator
MSDWRHHAACRDFDPELFFPINEQLPGEGVPAPCADQIREAKAVCANCPVRRECLDYALVTPRTLGIWGSTTTVQRRVIRQWISDNERVS